ncbi:hypothetical protein Q7689_20360, partial [Nocardiopsis tropica]|nr:hypothetical protein [Nocardiopsis tropica]
MVDHHTPGRDVLDQVVTDLLALGSEEPRRPADVDGPVQLIGPGPHLLGEDRHVEEHALRPGGQHTGEGVVAPLEGGQEHEGRGTVAVVQGAAGATLDRGQ